MLEKGYAMGAGCAKARARDVSFRRKFTCSSHSLDGQTFSGIDLLWIDPKVCSKDITKRHAELSSLLTTKHLSSALPI